MPARAVVLAFPIHRVRRKPSQVVFSGFFEMERRQRVAGKLAAACAALLGALIAAVALNG